MTTHEEKAREIVNKIRDFYGDDPVQCGLFMSSVIGNAILQAEQRGIEKAKEEFDAAEAAKILYQAAAHHCLQAARNDDHKGKDRWYEVAMTICGAWPTTTTVIPAAAIRSMGEK